MSARACDVGVILKNGEIVEISGGSPAEAVDMLRRMNITSDDVVITVHNWTQVKAARPLWLQKYLTAHNVGGDL